VKYGFQKNVIFCQFYGVWIQDPNPTLYLGPYRYLVPVLDFDRRYGTLFIPGTRELCSFDDLSGAVGMFSDSDPDPATQNLLRIQADPDPFP
jgi:hypothetical protein